MTDEKTQLTAIYWLKLDRWTFGASLIAALVLLPILSVFWIAAHPDAQSGVI